MCKIVPGSVCTGHQTGFVVRINCVGTRQLISNHNSIAYNMLYLLCAYLQYKLSILHHARMQLLLTISATHGKHPDTTYRYGYPDI